MSMTTSPPPPGAEFSWRRERQEAPAPGFSTDLLCDLGQLQNRPQWDRPWLHNRVCLLPKAQGLGPALLPVWPRVGYGW